MSIFLRVLRMSMPVVFLTLPFTSPAYSQSSERDRMVALDGQVTSAAPSSAPHADRSVFATGRELIQDGGFEGGYYAGSTYGSHGVTGPWEWWNADLKSDGSLYYANNLNPIWQNYGGTNARTGQYMAYFNPFGPSGTQISQTVQIPRGTTATLSFWLKIGATSSSSVSDKLYVCFGDYLTGDFINCPAIYTKSDASGSSWVYHSYDVSGYASDKAIVLSFTSIIPATTIFQLDDISLVVSDTTPAASCTEDARTMCLLNGRYRVTSYWKNQYSGGAEANLSKTKLTDATGAFWNADANTYEYIIRINTATNNGKAWVAISTLTDVEFFMVVTDTKTGQSNQYHSAAGNRTLIYDPNTFVYP